MSRWNYSNRQSEIWKFFFRCATSSLSQQTEEMYSFYWNTSRTILYTCAVLSKNQFSYTTALPTGLIGSIDDPARPKELPQYRINERNTLILTLLHTEIIELVEFSFQCRYLIQRMGIVYIDDILLPVCNSKIHMNELMKQLHEFQTNEKLKLAPEKSLVTVTHLGQ